MFFQNNKKPQTKKHVINLDHGNLMVDLATEILWLTSPKLLSIHEFGPIIVSLHTSNDLTRTASERFGNCNDKFDPWLILCYLIAPWDCNMFLHFA